MIRWLVARPNMMAALVFAAVVGSTTTVALGQVRPAVVEITVGDRTLVGSLLAGDDQMLWMLRPDGRLTRIDRRRVVATRPQGNSLVPISKMELHQQLSLEFGQAYQVSVTDHFVVVHPPGDHQSWAAPFEQLFHRFVAYFERRGTNLPEPEFPLVAVVLNSREEFDRFLRRYGRVDPQVIGYFSPTSNRVITYRDVGQYTGGHSGYQPSPTVIHEVAHQIAFNTGIHSRFTFTPKWMSEGLATMFEARGVHDSIHYGRPSDRRHERSWRVLQRLRENGALNGQLHAVVAEDRLFETDPEIAYAVSWALTYFLAETRHLDYVCLLGQSASRPAFQPYSSADRLRDFRAVLGAMPNEVEARVWQFLFDR